MRKRQKMVLRGRVQGVGFRYRAHKIANAMGLTGFVENLYSGEVHLQVEGDTTVIEEFVRRLVEDQTIRIDEIDATDLPCNTTEESFQIQ